MAQNIEIKARIKNRKNLINLVEKIADGGPVEIRQDDTFFKCTYGRLKLRELSPSYGQLIYYDRADIIGPKESSYIISETVEPESLRIILDSALGMTGRIRKKRLLYMYRDTRIHIDEVEGLGSFVEIEVVLNTDTVDTGQRIMEELMIRLHIELKDLLKGAYVDMIPVSFL